MNYKNQQPKTCDLIPRKRILVTGAKGQLGHKISQLLSTDYQLILTDSTEMNITDKAKVQKVIKSKKPDFIIHGAAYTKVDQAEDDKDLCRKINAEGTKNIAEAATEIGSTLIYISTDYVFDGMNSRENGVVSQEFSDSPKIPTPNTQLPTPYTEIDIPHPLSVYGQTKLEGENFIREICDKYFIIRASWLFGELPENHPGTNFAETMLRLGKERDSLSVVNDQIGSPTYTKDLVEIIDKIIRTQGLGPRTQDEKSTKNPGSNTHVLNPIPYGTYHFSGNNPCSWYDFAKEIFRISKIKIDLRPITSDQYSQKAKRPHYSYLSKDKIEKVLNIKVRTWQEMIKEYIINKDN